MLIFCLQTNSKGQSKERQKQIAKESIEKYFKQLTVGCGSLDCKNQFCQSSGLLSVLTPNQAAVRAIQLYAEDAKLCPNIAEKIEIIDNQQEQEPSCSNSKSEDVEMQEVSQG